MSADDHGHESTYVNWGCRCADCRAAHTDYQRRARFVRYAKPVPDGTAHGLSSTYTNWGCRCAECTTAHTEYKRELRQERAS